MPAAALYHPSENTAPGRPGHVVTVWEKTGNQRRERLGDKEKYTMANSNSQVRAHHRAGLLEGTQRKDAVTIPEHKPPTAVWIKQEQHENTQQPREHTLINKRDQLARDKTTPHKRV